MIVYTALSYSVASDLKYYGDSIENYLSSYWAIMQQPNAAIKAIHKYGKPFFLDSGAFSAMTKGVTIPVEDYIKFIKDNHKVIKVYSNLDVIGDYKRTDDNQKIMESYGLKPLPVFHYRSPESELRRLIKHYPYIALGGLVPLATNKNKLRAWLDYCFSIIKTDCKVHGFGMTSRWAQERYPFFSCDSTSAFEGSIRGTVSLGGKRLDPRNDVRAFGLMDRNGNKNYKQRVNAMIQDSNRRQDELTKLWESRGVKWD